MRQDILENGKEELRRVWRNYRGLLVAAGVFSVVVNLLMLTGPIYMLQVYDRVLGSQSIETLVGLTLVMAFLFLVMGVLDYTRGRVLGRIGAGFQTDLERRVFSSSLRRLAKHSGTASHSNSLRDLEAVQRFVSSPVFTAVFDIPWTPIFLLAIAIFHPWLGALAVAGGLVLVVIAILNQIRTLPPVAQAQAASSQAEHMLAQLQAEAEMIRALGMQDAAFDRWYQVRHRALVENLTSADQLGRFSALSKTFRLFLQSAMLGLGAYLAIQGEISPGAMIAGSILLGRALAPVDLAIGQWQVVQRARSGWRGLSELLAEIPQDPKRMQLPRPRAELTAENVTVVPPGQNAANLRMVNFSLAPGQALGVIGPSGSGKSTLARVITGAWSPAGGKMRLDGAALEQFDPAVLGQHIGYLPQRITLFDGTIAENIAGLALRPDHEKVVEAARRADAHDMILRLPDGYDTHISGSGGMLSGGQMQRIGLARALYGEPVVLVLDEPNSNLDNEGTLALNKAIRDIKSRQGCVIIMAHRPAAIAECDLLLMLEAGTVRSFGPRDEILARHVKNAQQIRSQQGQGGVQ
ncbi:ATP-binding cassette, subfamily C [Aliiroseovarius crassostreae]|uniref:Protease/lipase ABC transporter permease/ATP-binding protein n=1 Tax=Aliiroseovarius crassostreae TaxID=154981 RepID=A0A0P7KR19_9RHOB|nr:type I secretion system permease/ATPase [Aliiroseovarius crassostreae]KPN64941.1 protease/lipase ABC transporter permease/ATP-binding protein [Aliiroseovarius crassostreae]SFU61911.1 ATP-binding cassette, subfamily C [Aliiroseovarius crassostreae]